MNLRAPLAEFIGTFFLCFAGIAAILSNTPAVGAVVAALVYEHLILEKAVLEKA